MAQKTLTFSLTHNAAWLDAAVTLFARKNGWTATIPDPADRTKTVPNPVTAAALTKQILFRHFMQQAKEQKRLDAIAAARVNTDAAADAAAAGATF